MTPVPLDLPVKPQEAAALADLVFTHADGKPLTADLRNRLAARAAQLPLSSLTPFYGSLAKDPVHPATYYLAVDGIGGQPLLLRLSDASTPSSGLFPKALLIGRMMLQRGGAGRGREIVVNAVPFASTDHENLATFAQQVDRLFLPRPQGSRPAIAVGNRHPEVSLPAAFDAFAAILKSSGVNMASTVQLSATREMTTGEALAARDGENPTAAGHTRVSIRHLYHAGLWAAIRAGWREGYNAEADHFIVSGNTPGEIDRSVEAAKEAIRHAAGYTKFTTDTSRLFLLEADCRHPQAWSDAAVEERFAALFSAEEQGWLLDEFARPFPAGDRTYQLSRAEIVRLAVKFGQSLKLNEDLYDTIRRHVRSFDFEPSIDEAETLTTPEEMIFYMHWLKARGRPAQLVPPNLGFKKRQAYPESMAALDTYAHHKMWPELPARVEREFAGDPLEELGSRVAELAAVARHFNGTLSIHSGSGKQAAVLERIGKSTGGRVNYKISGELQLQLLDVLAEQPAGSPWRALYERMATRCNQFAAQGAFGAESELAAQYPAKYLGDAARGRVDGNLFLVFWIGNMVGSRDIDSPDGDRRFFKEKLDELPADLVAEVRRRNTQYIVWLTGQLRG
ncbi:MAG: hypothetical protein HYR60_10585 [Acidobacteria bacterium]|nr:hypothetical protein [Acidobacteriota bacterium]